MCREDAHGSTPGTVSSRILSARIRAVGLNRLKPLLACGNAFAGPLTFHVVPRLRSSSYGLWAACARTDLVANANRDLDLPVSIKVARPSLHESGATEINVAEHH